MNTFKTTSAALLMLLATATMSVSAQTTTSRPADNNPMYAPGSGYFGMSLGQSDYSLGNGIGVFGSDQGDTSYSIHGGSYFDNHFGVELGYTHFGTVNRAGGTTKAEGINLSLIGKMPVSPVVNLLAKVGTTYSRTDVSSDPTSGVVAGSENGFGLSYGIGVEYAFNPKWSGVLQYESQDMTFAGNRDDRVGVTSLGLRYRY